MTNDDWIGVNEMGGNINLYPTEVYGIFLFYFLNIITFGLVMAVLLDGFSNYLEEEEDNLENEFI